MLMILPALGCHASRRIRDPEYGELLDQMAAATASPCPAAESAPPVSAALSGPNPVDVYVRYALTQNPGIQAARKQVDAAAHRVPQAASLDDPTLSVMGYPFYPAVPQTLAGRSTAKIAATQAVPWFGKLETRAEVAEAETEMARRELAAAELEVIEQVKQAYYELYYVQTAIRITEDDKRLLVDLAKIAEAKYRAGTVSQQDVLRARVELSNVDSQLIRLGQELEISQARLARLLHVSPDTALRAITELPEEAIPQDLECLYQQAVATRPELQAQLAAIQRDRRSVELARLSYFPDFAFTADWTGMIEEGAMSPIADGIPDVGVGVMVNVPIYRKRLESGVRAAEAQVVAGARRYDALRDRTTEEVKNLFVKATTERELVRLFRDDIIPRSEQTLAASKAAYQVGEVDLLQLIDNWRQLLRFQIGRYRLESELRQTLAALERVLGGPLSAGTTGEGVGGVRGDQLIPLPPDEVLPVPEGAPVAPPGDVVPPKSGPAKP